MGKNEVPEETSNTVFHRVACSFTRLSQREKNNFGDVVWTPKGLGTTAKVFQRIVKTQIFWNLEFLSYITAVRRFVAKRTQREV